MGAGKRKNELREENGIWSGKSECTGGKDHVGGVRGKDTRYFKIIKHCLEIGSRVF